jgi:photosystem I subunit X
MTLLLLMVEQAISGDLTTGLNLRQIAPIISGACLLSLAIASRTIAHSHVGPKMPLGPVAPLFNNISVAGFLAAMSFGHILGALTVFGLSGFLERAA